MLRMGRDAGRRPASLPILNTFLIALIEHMKTLKAFLKVIDLQTIVVTVLAIAANADAAELREAAARRRAG